MEKAYQFDFVHDTQAVFRQLLQAFSHPARKYNIAHEASGFAGEWSQILAIGCTLLDNETSFYVEKTPRLHTLLIDFTLAKPAEFTKADYIFLTSPVNYVTFDNMMKTAKNGDLVDPQKAATFIIFCETLEGSTMLRVKGPGIKEEQTIGTTEYIKTILRIRQEQNIEYPCGIDLLFVTSQGKIMAMPRTCQSIE